MVYRVFSEKKPGLSPEVSALRSDCRNFLGITGLEDVRILNRYDAEGLDEALFDYARTAVFSEPQLDTVSERRSFPGRRRSSQWSPFRASLTSGPTLPLSASSC